MCLIYTHSVVAVHARHNEVCGRFCGLRFVWMLDFSLFIQGCFREFCGFCVRIKPMKVWACASEVCVDTWCLRCFLTQNSRNSQISISVHVTACLFVCQDFFSWILCARCGAEHSVEVWPGACPVGSGMCRVVYSSASFPWAKGECHKVGRGMVELSVIVGLRIWRRWCIGT